MGFVEGFEPALMEEKNDCGPVALLQALSCSGLRMELGELKRVWGWTGSDFLDTPWAHARAMRRLGVGFSMSGGWTAGEALAEIRRRPAFAGRSRFVGRPVLLRSGAAAAEGGRPVVLLVRRGFARFHWVVACGEEGGRLLISAGKGIETFDLERLDAELARGFVPFLLGCRGFGYVLGGDGGKCPLYARILGGACSVLLA